MPKKKAKCSCRCCGALASQHLYSLLSSGGCVLVHPPRETNTLEIPPHKGSDEGSGLRDSVIWQSPKTSNDIDWSMIQYTTHTYNYIYIYCATWNFENIWQLHNKESSHEFAVNVFEWHSNDEVESKCLACSQRSQAMSRAFDLLTLCINMHELHWCGFGSSASKLLINEVTTFKDFEFHLAWSLLMK